MFVVLIIIIAWLSVESMLSEGKIFQVFWQVHAQKMRDFKTIYDYIARQTHFPIITLIEKSSNIRTMDSYQLNNSFLCWVLKLVPGVSGYSPSKLFMIECFRHQNIWQDRVLTCAKYSYNTGLFHRSEPSSKMWTIWTETPSSDVSSHHGAWAWFLSKKKGHINFLMGPSVNWELMNW